MLAGHVGVALGLGRIERRPGIGMLLFGSLLLDLVLWTLVLSGAETVTVPSDYAHQHYLIFDFPYSHGLLSACFWSLLGAAAVYLCAGKGRSGRARMAIVMAIAVLSHWILDVIVHVRGLPIVGDNSVKVGLALWSKMPLELILEGLMIVAGLWLLLGSRMLRRGQAVGLSIFSLLILVLTVAGGTIAPAPPSPQAAAWSSLATSCLIVLLGGWLGKRPPAREGPAHRA